MSVEVKTPTRTQFEHVEFQCGEKQPSNIFHRSESNNEEVENKTEIGKSSVNLSARSARQVTISDHQLKPDGPKNFPKRRRFSTPAQRGQGSNFRKRRYSTKQDRIVLPTKFLLGGNIRDPLNLNSLYDDSTGFLLNQKTPNCSPLPFPVHRENVNLFIPPNITDPLNLNSGEDIDELALKFMAKKRRRNKHKKKQDEEISSTSVRITPGKESDKKKNLTSALKIDIDTANDAIEEKAGSDSEIVLSNNKKCDNKIVSPVIPQSLKSRKRRRTVSECMKPDFFEGLGSARRALLRTDVAPFDHDLHSLTAEPVVKKIKRQISGSKQSQQQPKPQTPVERKRKSSSNTQKKFIYGNYNRYYGYRNAELEEDTRLSVFRTEWFEGKDVLDIGCNVGHVTLAIARDFRPRKIVGMDIDGRLISAARKNIRHYLTATTVKTDQYPLSAKLNYGPIVTPSPSADKKFVFPNNIMFLQGNYVLDFDELLDTQKEDYDTIMSLSITKWIHLNFGDAGMKRFFKRIFKQLRPGGKLILEPQAWPSYKKKKKLTETIFSNFQTIKFKPDQFTDFLLSREVGFSTCEAIEVPFNKSSGFRRPIQLFTKPDTYVNSPNPVAGEKEDTKTATTTTVSTTSPIKSGTDELSSIGVEKKSEAKTQGKEVISASSSKPIEEEVLRV